MHDITIRAKRLTTRLDVPALTYATPGSSGLDLYAAIDEPVSLRGGGATAIPVGYAVEIPEGYEGHVRGRSGLAKNDHIGITNGIGTIDSDYRGELVVLLSHLGHFTEHKWIMPGEKIAQLVIVPVMHATVEDVGDGDLSDTQRGTNGFGSTGNGLGDSAAVPAAVTADTAAIAAADAAAATQAQVADATAAASTAAVAATTPAPDATTETQTITGADVGDANAVLGQQPADNDAAAALAAAAGNGASTAAAGSDASSQSDSGAAASADSATGDAAAAGEGAAAPAADEVVEQPAA
jgi:dUTP pyrophosphatase